jgi:anti-sigma B factor antagonist
MVFGSTAIVLKRLPGTLSLEKRQLFVRELGPCLTGNRPRIVLDLSNLSYLDRPTIHLLLGCLEEAMKRNGDVRISGATPEVRATLKSVGVDRLFRIFELEADAVGSFHRHIDDVRNESEEASP